MENALVESLKSGGLSQRKALEFAGISRSSWQYRHRPRPQVQVPKPHTHRRAGHWLRQEETARVTAKLEQGFATGQSVHQCFYEALDAGDPVASLKSWYRIAERHVNDRRPVRARRRGRRVSTTPELVAEAPGRVWTWDITKLKGPYRYVAFEAYVVIDIFSRKIIAYRVEEREEDELAREMFLQAIAAEGAPVVVHSDGGPSMTSSVLQQTLVDHGIEVSKNRPRVSNENPFSEAWFKTAKYSIGYPEYFEHVDHARQWVTAFVAWYNAQHRHSELEGHTPASVHDGSWLGVHHRRQATLDGLFAANPARYSRAPMLRAPLAEVTINREKSTDRLQTV